MQVLILNGSPRPKGHTKQMIQAFCEGLETAGHGSCGAGRKAGRTSQVWGFVQRKNYTSGLLTDLIPFLPDGPIRRESAERIRGEDYGEKKLYPAIHNARSL